MKLISEQVENVEFIFEEKEGKGKEYKIKGIFLQGEVKNRNGRVYPMEVLDKEVSRYNREFIEQNRAMGALAAPMGNPQLLSINIDHLNFRCASLHQATSLIISRQASMKSLWVLPK